MRRTQTLIYRILLLVCIGLAIFFGIQLYNTILLRQDNLESIQEIEAIPVSEVKVDITWHKEIVQEDKEETIVEAQNIYATYDYENLEFISYSNQWDKHKLELLCKELLLNVHGWEIDYLGKITIYPQKDNQMAGYQQQVHRTIEVPLQLQGTLPENFRAEMFNQVSDIVLYNGDEDNTIESMARVLSHEYGHHFTLFHFYLEEDLMKLSKYYELRYFEDSKIRTTGDDFEEYMENHLWYLIEIAANDYVYLMGSPNTRQIETYYDAIDSLKIKLKDDEGADGIISTIKDSFNMKPHENVVIPLPDQVEGLPELFYGIIGKTSPSYENRDESASSIEIKIKQRYELGHSYYDISWNKPWKDEDVIYTLVAYNENDKLLGGIKSIKANEKAHAYIGETVVTNAGNTKIYWWNGRWTTYDFLRMRIVVTFPDGTAVVSSPLDKVF
ncbi:MAG: hypothetical protein KAQ68_02610 [Clostridiales bacterium]|nr:hypothetical protein [Clostridiales bacterium]